MAVVCKQGGWYVVELGGLVLGQFTSLLDAHCFALQLLERELASSVQLFSGITVT